MSNTKIAMITGSSGGIGTALCSVFAGAGYRVLGLDCRPPTEETYEHVDVDLARLSVDADYWRSTAQKIRRLVPSAGLDVLVNNAAVQVVKPTEDLTAEDWHQTLNTNVVAPFLLTQALLPELERAAGAVVNVASVHALLTKPRFVSYATSKAALVGLTRSMAVDLGGRVRVNAIKPAATATPMLLAGFDGRQESFSKLASMHPVQRIATPKEIAQAALFLASKEAAFITGTILNVDGGIGARLHDPE